MLQVTPAAVEAIKKQVDSMGKSIDQTLIRLYVSAGWGGPQYQLALEESAQSNDEVITEDGVTFVISDRFNHYFENIKLDYAKSLFGGKQFQFLKV